MFTHSHAQMLRNPTEKINKHNNWVNKYSKLRRLKVNLFVKLFLNIFMSLNVKKSENKRNREKKHLEFIV